MNNKKAKRIRQRAVQDLYYLEVALKRALLSFYNKYIKGSQSPVAVLRLKYGTQIRNIIQSTIQKSYIKGMDLVGKSIKIPDFDILISTTDLNNIETLSMKMEVSFWRTAQRLLMRETEFKVLEDGDLEKKDPFDKNAAMVATSALVVYSAFNQSILSKEQELGGSNQVQFTTANDADVDPTLCAPKNGAIYPANYFPPDSNPPIHRNGRCTLIPV